MKNSLEEMRKRRKMLYPSFKHDVTDPSYIKTNPLYINLEQDEGIPSDSSYHFINDTLLRIVDIKWAKYSAIPALFKHLYIIHTDETIMKAGYLFSKKSIEKLEFDEHKINSFFDSIQ